MTTRKIISLIAVCFLFTLNVFAQNNISIQPKAKAIEKQETTIATQKNAPEMKPLFEKTSKPTPISTADQKKAVLTSKPVFRTAYRPKIDKKLDKKIRTMEEEIAKLKADPNRDELTLMKYEAGLDYLLELERKNTDN